MSSPHSATTPGWPLLAHVTYSRRQRLGLSQQAVEDRGGPGSSTLRTIETQNDPLADPRISPRTLGKLDYALAWPAGTADCLVRGNIPEAVRVWDDFISISINDIDDRPHDTIAARLDRHKIGSVSDEVEQLNNYQIFSDYYVARLKESATEAQADYIAALENNLRKSRYIILGWIQATQKDT